jgi:hypothetical protein
MKFLVLLLSLTITFTANARLSDADLQRLDASVGFNLGFEHNLAGWSNSGGTFAQETTEANVGMGKASASFDASAADQYVVTNAIVLDKTDVGKACGISVYAKGDSDSYQLQMLDATDSDSVIASSSLAATASTFERTAINIASCPAQIKIKVISVVDGDVIYLDRGKVGQNVFRKEPISEDIVYNKYLPSNDSSTLPAITFDNLIIGEEYTVNFHANCYYGGVPTGAVGAIMYHNGVAIGDVLMQASSGSVSAIRAQGNAIARITATATTVTFSHTGQGYCAGNGTTSQTWAQLIHHKKSNNILVPFESGAESIRGSGVAGRSGSFMYFSSTVGEISEYGTVVNDGTNGFNFIPNQDVIVDTHLSGYDGGDSNTTANIDISGNTVCYSYTGSGMTSGPARPSICGFSGKMTKGQMLRYSSSTLSSAWFSLSVRPVKASALGALPVADMMNIGDVKTSLLTESQYQAIHGNNWVLCDGRDVSGSKYATLTGSTTVPNMANRFLRMVGDDSVALGLTQEDAFQGHWHNLRYRGDASGGGTGGYVIWQPNATSTNSVQDAISDGVNGTPRKASETRPKNVSVNFFCKIN